MGVSATLLALSSVLTSVNVANAATFNFSFSNEDGPVAGTVSGTITLPDGDGTFVNSSQITVTSAPPALGYTLPFDVTANFTTQVVENTFTVVSGAINAAVSRFYAFFSPDNIIGSAFGLNSATGLVVGSSFNVQLSSSPSTGVIDGDSSTLSYSAVSTPEPTSVITLIGVGVLGVASKLKKKA